MLRHVCATIDVPVVLDVDLAGVGVGDGGEGLLREVDGAPAPRGAKVDNLDGDAPSGARVRHALVRRTGAPHHVTSPHAAPPSQKTSLDAAIIVPSVDSQNWQQPV